MKKHKRVSTPLQRRAKQEEEKKKISTKQKACLVYSYETSGTEFQG
jgi:hypothetical protein